LLYDWSVNNKFISNELKEINVNRNNKALEINDPVRQQKDVNY